jgi:hypothetical protein
MKKFVVLAGLVAAALLLGMAGTAVRSNDAQAKPEDVITFSPQICISLMRVIEGDCDPTVETGTECDAACTDAHDPDDLNDLARALEASVSDEEGAAPESDIAACGDGVDDDADTVADDGCAEGYNDPALWQDLNDLSGAQLGDYSAAGLQGWLWVLTFVTNDGALTLEADEGIWGSNGASNTNCAAIADQDCDDDGTKGDKIVVDYLYGNDVADLGDAELVATQAGVDVIYDYVVVGEPEDIALAFLSDGTVQEDAAECADDPHLTPLDSSVFLDGAAEPEKNGLVATVTDDDGTELAGIYVDWSSDDEDVADLNLPKSISWALESGTFAVDLFCGDGTGTATITADIGAVDDAEVDVTVIGAPDAMTLTASPASITCDGVNSSTVSAALVDSEGNKVVDGTEVRFEVVALGIADPITADTAAGAGAATSKITPLSGVSAGVVVMVTVEDAEGDVVLEGNIRIDCALPVAPPPPPPVSPTGPTVVPPGTGDGGYLP